MYIKNNVQDKTLPPPQVYIVTNHFLQSTSCLTLLLFASIIFLIFTIDLFKYCFQQPPMSSYL